ncbi:sensor histidine kinase [Sellimonas catena]|uniref:histidine kinase n=1 Tax=Sellimonas catena TaxID=2994035 RepID=A0A9W6C9Y1_9FIRM|nr:MULTISPECIES: HAMP domain-containing sensor histidine kinase [Clostridia]OUN71427.1 histidine kinase [Drancourtella sp. An57]OUP01941.1 histidine kinase [Drancourtella sp. An210]GLG04569.1 hypothetical protein Selli1_17430 [Sellimonas catena]GLG88755.1 hypothetical protein Selli2_01810 [Sellimonas catena]
MYLTTLLSFLIGIIMGGCAVYIRQKKLRMEELKKAASMTEDILAGRKLFVSSPGDELMLSRIENQLVRIQEMLEGRRKEAEKSRDEIQKLISEVAHQMRTPLANIESYTCLLGNAVEDVLTGEKEMEQISGQYISSLEESEKKLHFLVDSFVKMARLEHHVIQIRKNECDLCRTIQNTFGQIQNRAEEKEIQFHIDMPERAVCSHDPNWLGEAIYNILDNAVKYSGQRGIVEVILAQNELYFKLQVRDHGIGIEEGEENLIFRRFYRGRRVTIQEGFGIGLYLAREIIHLHGGFLTAKRADFGLIMEVNLPL